MRRFVQFLQLLAIAAAWTATLLVTTPALAGGATSIIIAAPPAQVGGGISPQNGNYTGAMPTQIITYLDASAARVGTFATAPAVGDILVAACFNGTFSAGAGTPAPNTAQGWVQFATGAQATRHSLNYLVVVTAGVTSYTPCTDIALSNGSVTVIEDIHGLSSSVWANVFQNAIINAPQSLGPVNTEGPTARDQTLILAFAGQQSNAGSYTSISVTGITGGLVQLNPISSNPGGAGAFVGQRFSGDGATLSVTSALNTGGFYETDADLVQIGP